MRLFDYWNLARLARDSGKHAGNLRVLKALKDTAVWINDTDLAFDGSDNFQEWFSNFRFLRWGKWGTHRGFYQAASMFFEQIEKEIETGKTYNLFGHSRGGAIAQIVALLIAKKGAFASVVSFGSPKVGGEKFRNAMAESMVLHVRVEMEGDHVPKLPWWWKHYETDHVLIANTEKNGIDSHMQYGKYLEKMGVDYA